MCRCCRGEPLSSPAARRAGKGIQTDAGRKGWIPFPSASLRPGMTLGCLDALLPLQGRFIAYAQARAASFFS